MNDLTLARSIAGGRIAFGPLMLLIPNTVLARAAEDRPGPLVWLARAFGIRDIVLGLGALQSLAEPEPDAVVGPDGSGRRHLRRGCRARLARGAGCGRDRVDPGARRPCRGGRLEGGRFAGLTVITPAEVGLVLAGPSIA